MHYKGIIPFTLSTYPEGLLCDLNYVCRIKFGEYFFPPKIFYTFV